MDIDKIELCALKGASDWKEVLGMPRGMIHTDWWGRQLERPFRYALGRDGQYLVYVSEVPFRAPVAKGLKHGAFVENLAEPETRGDTAELFVMFSDGRYFEVHINPEGAWWYMNFSSYRKREPGRIPARVDVRIERGPNSWVGAIRLPLSELPELKGSLKFQATAAVCSGASPVYVTSAGAPGFEPDFHDERCFRQGVAVLPLST
jgi:hypothetical protein